MENATISLPNRFHETVELVHISDDCWRLEAPSHVRYGIDPGTNVISFFDPPGGPFVMVGELIGGHVVVAIQCTETGTLVWMIPKEMEDFEKRSADIRTAVKIAFGSSERPRFVVGIIGKAGSGKDTVGDYLKKKYEFTGLALADTLKRVVQEMFVIPDDVMHDRVKREKPLPDMPDWSVRKLLQFVGTELIRNHIDDAAWTKSLIKRYPKTGNIVVTDVRFPNEISDIRELSGCPVFFIRVTRPGYVGTDVGIKNHASEIHELEGDFTIVNSTTIEDIHERVDEVMTEIGRCLDERND